MFASRVTVKPTVPPPAVTALYARWVFVGTVFRVG
jgi:hypothetical protein